MELSRTNPACGKLQWSDMDRLRPIGNEAILAEGKSDVVEYG
jgi:hypothetical protein